MIVIGLTGSIGMGKSTTAKMFEAEGVPFFDADAEAHRLMAKGGAAVPNIEEAFPGTVVDGAIDRQALGQQVFGDEAALMALENILHPMIGENRERFMADAKAQKIGMVVLDIPLLFEKGHHDKFDAVVVATAPADVQRQRVLARDGMTADKFDAILSLQMPDVEKRKHADYVVETDKGLDEAREQVRAVIDDLNKRETNNA